MAQQISDFEQFWPHFLAAHQNPATRWAHVASAAVATFGLFKSVRKGSVRPLVGSALAAGALAVLSHRFIEGNGPASANMDRDQRHPLWTARAVARLCVRTVTGTISKDLENLPTDSAQAPN